MQLRVAVTANVLPRVVFAGLITIRGVRTAGKDKLRVYGSSSV